MRGCVPEERWFSSFGGFFESRAGMWLMSMVFIASAGVAFNHSNSKVPEIFDNDHYEIKSCLSPDLESHEERSCRFFSLTIDAGSTGTRIHIFEFSHDTENPASPFKLEGEVFKEVKPGLSGFEDSPKKAAQSVEELLEKARATVPRQMWAHTPLTLKATAGLRLLPAEAAENILKAVENVFKASPFLINEEAVTIMSGTDEGVFGWFTLNFLLDRIDAVLLQPEELSKTVSSKLTAAALDLGGGSTQITFRPLEEETREAAPPDHMLEIKVFGQPIQLYTHSYLGNGLMATRLGTLQLSNGAKDSELNLKTACMPTNFELSWVYSGHYSVKGSADYSFESCSADVRNYVESTQIFAPDEIRNRDLFAFSYFYDRALQAGLVKDERGGVVSVSSFKAAAEKACRVVEFGPEHWRPWQCLDLSYIYALLSSGYNLPDDKEITLAKKMRGMETSWALGASYHLLNTYHEQKLRGEEGSKNSTLRGQFTKAGFYLCSRVYYGLSHLMGYFQLFA